MKMILFTTLLFLTSCSYNHINGYNLLDSSDDNSNLYQEYFIQESISLLKIQRPPARNKIILVEPVTDKFSSILINRLRNAGYSIDEITSEDAIIFKAKENQFIFSYTIDNLVYEDDTLSEFHYISLQIFVNDIIYSRVYRTNYDDGYLSPSGYWSVKDFKGL